MNGILLSIDLIVKNENGEILVGERKNRPAQGYWFVPGGRVYKNESFREALNRICNAEIGILKSNADYKFLGIFNHIYEDNFFDDPKFNTHYATIGIELKLENINMSEKMHQQHDQSKFMSIPEILSDKKVHDNTRYYFIDNPPNRFI